MATGSPGSGAPGIGSAAHRRTSSETGSLPSTGWHSQKGVLLGYYGFGSEAVKISMLSPADRAKYAVAAGQKIFPQYAESYETSFSKSWHLDPHNLGGWANVMIPITIVAGRNASPISRAL